MTDDSNAAPVDAVRALRNRGVDDAEDLLGYGTPEQILAACRRWDARKGVRKGLLVKWIREQDFPVDEPAPTVNRAAQLRSRFDEYARRYPVGAAVELHMTLVMRRWPGDAEWGESCAGGMVVTSVSFPLLEMECDRCGFTTAVGPRHLHALGDKADW